MPLREPKQDLDAFAAALERILSAQLESQRQVREILTSKRDALRRADIKAVAALAEQEHPLVRRLGELEKQRMDLIGRFSAALGSGSAAAVTVSRIAAAIGEPGGSRLTALAHELKSTVADVRRSSSILRVASEALARHISGVLQVVGSAMSGASVYGRKGQVALGAPLQFTIDIKS